MTIDLKSVCSGAQTGADVGGLAAAKACGIPTGGWMPNGCMTLDGPRRDLLETYNLKEHPKKGYPPRTDANVKDSDGTLRFASKWYSAGEKCTMKAIKWYGKPHFDIDITKPVLFDSWFEVYKWLSENNIKVLNIAGNSEETSPGIYQFVYDYLTGLFTCCLQSMNRDKIKLYQLSEGNPETNLYVFSTLNDLVKVRNFWEFNDQGGMEYEDYQRVATTGTMTEITQLDQVPEPEWDILPWSTDEWIGPERYDYFDMDESIYDFFHRNNNE